MQPIPIELDGSRSAPSVFSHVGLLRQIVFGLIDETRQLSEPYGVDVADALQRVANELGAIEAQLRYALRRD